LVPRVLGDADNPADLGEQFPGGLSEREIAYFVESEWARNADDVLWRRTKVGLQLDEATRARVASCVAHYAAAP
jgi:glycerol-3-phosphate dehydrogenase